MKQPLILIILLLLAACSSRDAKNAADKAKDSVLANVESELAGNIESEDPEDKGEEIEPTFEELARKHKVHYYTLGNYKIADLGFISYDTFPDMSTTVRKTHNFYHLVIGIEYKSVLADHFTEWAFLLPLKKVFLFPDSTLGIVTFEATGGFTTGSPGSGITYLSVNIERILSREKDLPGKNDFAFDIDYESSESSVSIGPDTNIKGRGIKHIKWLDNNSLLVVLRNEEENPRPDEQFKVVFTKAGNDIVAKVTELK